MNDWREEPLVFGCGDDTLLGVLSMPVDAPRVGVVIVVGGPQYRAGSHRQFTLLARALAEAGHVVVRFDYRGLGDASGKLRGFESIGADIRAAVDILCAKEPGLHRVVLWGLCDAASAICFHAHEDSRVSAVVLANPWVRTSVGEAKTLLKHYYLQRLMDRSFWHKVLHGRFNPLQSLKSLLGVAGKAAVVSNPGETQSQTLPERMSSGLLRFNGPVLMLLSGQDFVSQEFQACIAQSPRWQQILGRPQTDVEHLPDANHTFSSQVWRQQVESLTAKWLHAIT